MTHVPSEVCSKIDLLGKELIHGLILEMESPSCGLVTLTIFCLHILQSRVYAATADTISITFKIQSANSDCGLIIHCSKKLGTK